MVLLVFSAGWAAWCAPAYWARLSDNAWKKRFWPWFLQGLVCPCLAWSLCNFGWGNLLPALLPEIVLAQQGNEPWIGLWVRWSLAGSLFIAIQWTALTYLWLLAMIGIDAPDKREFAATVLMVGLVSVSAAAAAVYFTDWIHLGAAVCLATLPLVHCAIDLAEVPPSRPTYSRAVGKLNFGKYKDAEWEMISQLEKSENDFEGWMMLGELYAKRYRNMDDAARIVFDICAQPETKTYEISLACHKLADWQLEVAANPLGARAALEMLIRRTAGTHFARMAEQRLRQIPSSVEEYDESRKTKVIRLPALREEMSEAPSPALSATSKEEALKEAERLTAKLFEDSNDISAREKLATVLAEKLGKTNLGVDQLNLLLELQAPTDEQKAKWCALIAHWEYHQNNHVEKFCSALRAIIRDYPQTATAFSAQRRINLLTERHAGSAPEAAAKLKV